MLPPEPGGENRSPAGPGPANLLGESERLVGNMCGDELDGQDHPAGRSDLSALEVDRGCGGVITSLPTTMRESHFYAPASVE